ncbi:MAG TPA: hypothetical protein PKZ53_18845 [Acidobacteriota bacterium]|nr:hypothetical protein [Acidobacteriota bacterium]
MGCSVTEQSGPVPRAIPGDAGNGSPVQPIANPESAVSQPRADPSVSGSDSTEGTAPESPQAYAKSISAWYLEQGFEQVELDIEQGIAPSTQLLDGKHFWVTQRQGTWFVQAVEGNGTQGVYTLTVIESGPAGSTRWTRHRTESSADSASPVPQLSVPDQNATALPADVPVHPSLSALVTPIQTNQAADEMFAVFESPETVTSAELTQWFQTEMKRFGWESTPLPAESEPGMAAFLKGTTMCLIIISPNPDLRTSSVAISLRTVESP